MPLADERLDDALRRLQHRKELHVVYQIVLNSLASMADGITTPSDGALCSLSRSAIQEAMAAIEQVKLKLDAEPLHLFDTPQPKTRKPTAKKAGNEAAKRPSAKHAAQPVASSAAQPVKSSAPPSQVSQPQRRKVPAPRLRQG